MNPQRHERVRELLKRTVSEVLRREVSIADYGLISVNDVKIARDLQSALIFVGVIGNADKQKKAEAFLDSDLKRLQSLVGSGLALRHTPKLKFIFDHAIERGNRVIAILDELQDPAPGADASKINPT